MTDEDFDFAGLETVLFTAMSVALEALESMLAQVPIEKGGPALGYMKATSRNARAELDLFLVDRDPERVARVNVLISDANEYLKNVKGS